MGQNYNIDGKLFFETFKSILLNESENKSLFSLYISDSNEKKSNKGRKTPWTLFIEEVYIAMEQKFREKFNVENDDVLNLYSSNSNISELKYKSRGEFMKIDATFFDERRDIDETKMVKAGLSNVENKIWRLLAAVEHENSSTHSIYEVKQLLLFNTPLRVLISYWNEEKYKSFYEFIDNYFSVFNDVEEASPMKEGDEFLMIFGNSGGKSNKIIYSSILITKQITGELKKENYDVIEIFGKVEG